ncbi:MAG: NAD(P)/FAD-dependent oxidoreductase [Janthinobacterium lividum]
MSAIVIGGGIVGRISALRMQQAGMNVVLIDPDAVPQPASFGNAGHVATEQVRPITNLAFLRSVPRRLFLAGGPLDVGWRRPRIWLPWAIQAVAACFRADAGERALTTLLAKALPAWQRLVTDLGCPGLLVGNGHLILWHDRVKGEAGARAWRQARTGTARVVPMPDDALDRVAQHMAARPAVGLRIEGTAQVSDVGETMRVLAEAFEAAGGRRMRSRAIRLVRKNRQHGVVLSDGSTVWADRMLVAAGVGSGRLLRTLGVTMPLIAERGYHVEWQHGGGYDLPPLVFEGRSVIVTRFGDRLRASSFVEFTAEGAPPDPRKWQRLEAHVRALGLPVASAFSRWMGARPTLPDYLPAIGSLDASGLVVACGHQHLGLTLAPITAELVVALMTGQEPSVTLAPFSPTRFGFTSFGRTAPASSSS